MTSELFLVTTEERQFPRFIVHRYLAFLMEVAMSNAFIPQNLDDDWQSGYVLGHSVQEMQRLMLQGNILRPITERLLRSAGIRSGMRVLDVGCGAGDVSMLAAELVGPSGSVLGVDRNGIVLDLARERVRLAGLSSRIQFKEASLDELVEPASFDLVAGRYVLVHQGDPAAFVRAAAAFVRPGGALAFHELGIWKPDPSGRLTPFDQAMRWAAEAARLSFLCHDAAGRLAKLFFEAGLERPELFCETPVGSGDSILIRWLAASVRSLLPVILKENIANEETVAIDTLEDRIRKTASDTHDQHQFLEQVCAWVRL